MAEDPVSVHRKIGIRDMIEACRYEAHRIEGTQRALVEGGLRAAPAEDQMERVRVFDATALFLERIEPYIDDLVRRQQWKNRRHG